MRWRLWAFSKYRQAWSGEHPRILCGVGKTDGTRYMTEHWVGSSIETNYEPTHVRLDEDLEGRAAMKRALVLRTCTVYP